MQFTIDLENSFLKIEVDSIVSIVFNSNNNNDYNNP